MFCAKSEHKLIILNCIQIKLIKIKLKLNCKVI